MDGLIALALAKKYTDSHSSGEKFLQIKTSVHEVTDWADPSFDYFGQLFDGVYVMVQDNPDEPNGVIIVELYSDGSAPDVFPISGTSTSKPFGDYIRSIFCAGGEIGIIGSDGKVHFGFSFDKIQYAADFPTTYSTPVLGTDDFIVAAVTGTKKIVGGWEPGGLHQKELTSLDCDSIDDIHYFDGHYFLKCTAGSGMKCYVSDDLDNFTLCSTEFFPQYYSDGYYVSTYIRPGNVGVFQYAKYENIGNPTEMIIDDRGMPVQKIELYQLNSYFVIAQEAKWSRLTYFYYTTKDFQPIRLLNDSAQFAQMPLIRPYLNFSRLDQGVIAPILVVGPRDSDVNYVIEEVDGIFQGDEDVTGKIADILDRYWQGS